MEHAKYLWQDGKLRPWEEATVHITHVGVAGATKVYEGIRAYWNDEHQELYVFCLGEHLRRFGQGMKLTHMKPSLPLEGIGQGILELLRANEERRDVYVRPIAFINEPGPIMSAPRIGATPTIAIYTVPSAPRSPDDKVLSSGVSSWVRISDNVMPPRVKAAANYRNGRLANIEAQLNGYDKPIILDYRGKVSESAGACLMIVRDGVLITPPVTASILESITRTVLMKFAREALGIQVEEREIDRTELYLADEVFLCGTGEEVSPIGSVDRLPVGDGKPGPIARQLRAVYRDIVRGKDGRHSEWRTPVWQRR